ncbi:hypothetical protein MUP46_00800 [Patescibacteria group bacterium]|nr:hypothetical protein [Patescibacteria group bacterium]
MLITLLHFSKEEGNYCKEYIVLATHDVIAQSKNDAKEDGYILANSITFDGDVSLPINKVLD